MLTVNANEHPVMQQFHRAGNEKRTPVILTPNQFSQWLDADEPQAMRMMNWRDMPQLQSGVALKG